MFKILSPDVLYCPIAALIVTVKGCVKNNNGLASETKNRPEGVRWVNEIYDVLEPSLNDVKRIWAARACSRITPSARICFTFYAHFKGVVDTLSLGVLNPASTVVSDGTATWHCLCDIAIPIQHNV